MKRAYIIGGILAAAILGAFLVYKARRKAKAAAAGPTAGGIFAPKNPLTLEDYSNLEQIFSSGNPYETETAQSIEGQPISETEPGSGKQLITQDQFNNMVLIQIRRTIGERSAWIQQIENERFKEWTGAARAGYSNSLAQALAYNIRVNLARSKYYTPGAGTPGGNSGSVNYNQIFQDSGYGSLSSLSWTPTNVPTVITALTAPDPVTGQQTRQYFDLQQKRLITANAAKMQGVQIS